MRDSLGKEIDVGDRVVYSHSRYADLRHGRVVAITSRMIRIKDFFPGCHRGEIQCLIF